MAFGGGRFGELILCEGSAGNTIAGGYISYGSAPMTRREPEQVLAWLVVSCRAKRRQPDSPWPLVVEDSRCRKTCFVSRDQERPTDGHPTKT